MGRKAASMGTLGAIGPSGVVDLGHTTPDPVAIHDTLEKLAKEGVTHAAMEASSHGLSQYRLHGVKLAAGAFTNLTQDHLDYHADFDDYRRAKLKLFSELLPAGAPAIINADSLEREAFETAAEKAGLRTFTVGWRGRDLRISEALPRGTGQDLVIQWGSGALNERKVHLPLIGEFQALNALCAAGIAMALGDDVHAVLDGLTQLKGVHGRLELVGQTAGKAPVFVDYAHTPDGLNVLLRAARPHVRGKLIVVFGCGGDRDTTKRPIMGDVARRLADEVIITDDNPRSEEPAAIRATIRKGAPDASEIGDRASAIQEGVRRLKPGDALLIAGKGHETGQIVKGVTIPFSDFDVARAALQEVGGTHG
jgi:UDP-N-acetylmuramoyl-L-alanyl-D-glutamate--2,6-diaminopimelate ligase